jgi:hypothetical protein
MTKPILLARHNFCFVLIAVICCSLSQVFAQPGVGLTYTFQNAAGFAAFPVPPPAITTQLNTATPDDNGYLLPIGGSVKFNGQTYTQFVVSSNGWLALIPASWAGPGVPPSLSAGNFLSTNSLSTYAGGYPLIAPYWDDIATNSFRYVFNNGALWVQWISKIDKTNTTASQLFWVRIDGTTGVINFYYNSNAYTIFGTPSASIGIASGCAGEYYSYNTLATYADSTIETNNISTRVSNATYTFTPYQLYDNCANAKDLGPLTTTCTPVLYSINSALSSGSPVSCSPSGTDTADMWFKVVKPTGIQNLTITTSPATPACQSVTGTSIEVFASCGGALVACSTTSTANPGFGETVLARSCNVETLYIRVTADDDNVGKFKICAKSTSTANGINCSAPIPICAPLPFNATGLTTNGSVDDYSDSILCQSTYTLGQDYIFSYTPSITQCIDLWINNTGLNSYPGLFITDGCPNDTDFSLCVASATNISNGDTISNVTLSAGHTYYIMVDNDPSPGHAVNNYIPFDIHMAAAVGAAPPNDNCLMAAPLGTVPSNANCTWSGTFSTQCSTPSPATPGYPNPGCGGFNSALTNDVWLTFTAGFSGTLQINSQGITTNPLLHGGMAVYTGTCGNLTLVGCAGDSVAIPYMPSLTLTVSNLTQYYIRFWAAAGFDPGSFRLCFVAGCSPPNDLPINAIPIPLATPVMGDNTCSTGTGEMAAPVNCTTAPINTVWFSVIVPPTGQLAIRISQLSLMDAALAAFTFPTGVANAATSFTRLDCNDDIIFAPPCPICGMDGDGDAAIDINALPGSTVYIAVDGEGPATGSFYITAIQGTLTSTFPPVYKKDCANPEIVCSNNDLVIPNGGVGSYGNVCDFLGLACGTISTSEVGSNWFTFTVAPGSELGFTISPNDTASPIANYNFYLWDITNTTIATICTTLASTPPIRCNTQTGTGRTGLRNPAIGPFSTTVPANATPHNYMLFVENLTSASDDEGVPGTNTGFVLNWDIYTGGVFSGMTQIAGSSNTCNWTGVVIDTNYQNVNNWKGVGSCPAPVPSCNTDVFISAASRQCMVTGNSYAKSITINPGGTLVLGPAGNLHVCGDFTNNGTIIASPTSTVTFEGVGVNQLISGSITGTNSLGNLVINKPNFQVNLQTNIDLNGSFTTSNATSIFNINGKYMKVAGNFTNANGTGTFTGIAPPGLNGSTVEFTGNTDAYFNNQLGLINLNDVVMNKTGKLYLVGANSRMNIDSTLTMTSGIIVTPTAIAPYQEVNIKYYLPAALIGGNNNSYIIGYLRRKISNFISSPVIPASYNFPLGDTITPLPGGFENANITFTTATQVFDLTGTFKRWPAGPPIQGPVASECLVATYSNKPIFDNGYWSFRRSTANFSGRYTITLNNTGFSNNTGAGWTVAKSDTTANVSLSASWRLVGNCVIASSASNTQRSNINPAPYADSLSFNSNYATAQTELVLPIELLYFIAEPNGENVECAWETSSETNNEYFEVERSDDGENFNVIGKVKGFGAGTSTESKKYSLIDDRKCNDIIYYRLHQVDIDGTDSYSDVVAVNCNKSKALLTIQPNPGQTKITLSFVEAEDGLVTINFIDYTGRTVYTLKPNAIKGFNKVPVDIENLSDGVYYIDLRSEKLLPDDTERQVRFIKN